MKLTKYRVTEFRSVEDSGWIDTYNVTTLIGTNESGKTNMMLPLWKLNPADEGHIDLILDMPRKKYLILRKMEQKPIFIRAIFELNEEELTNIAQFAKLESVGFTEVQIAKDYDGKMFVEFISNGSEDYEGLSNNKELKDYILKEMPKFVYYSSYGNIDSEVYLPQVVENLKRNNLGEKESARMRTLRMLFDFVKLNPIEIQQLGSEKVTNDKKLKAVSAQKKEREILLQSAAVDFTTKFNNWWKQGNYTFDFQADGDFFRIWVSDDIRRDKIELESRSAGLQWFFSFYLTFLIECEAKKQKAILLLDEPGLTLHPIAQTDLFAFFEKLSDENQIIFSTHSPFMVNSNYLGRVASIYVNDQGYSCVNRDLRISNQSGQVKSVYPVQVALNLVISNSLMQNSIPVIVEKKSDQIYFNALKNYLISQGEFRSNRELVFVPAGGLTGITALLPLLIQKDNFMPWVILNSDESGKEIAQGLLNGIYKDKAKQVILLQGFGIEEPSIEDIIPSNIMRKIIVRNVPKSPVNEEEFEDVYDADCAVLPQVEAYILKHKLVLNKTFIEDVAMRIKSEIIKQADIYQKEKEKFENLKKLFATISQM